MGHNQHSKKLKQNREWLSTLSVSIVLWNFCLSCVNEHCGLWHKTCFLLFFRVKNNLKASDLSQLSLIWWEKGEPEEGVLLIGGDSQFVVKRGCCWIFCLLPFKGTSQRMNALYGIKYLGLYFLPISGWELQSTGKTHLWIFSNTFTMWQNLLSLISSFSSHSLSPSRCFRITVFPP